MIFVTVSQKGHSDSKLYGPFKSIDEGKKKVTDDLDRGNDGDETRYTFFKIIKIKEIGVHSHDECVVRTQDIREEYFPNV